MAEKMENLTINEPDQTNNNSSVLDLAFALDCTGSMGAYIKTAQKNIRDIVKTIVEKENADVCLALVKYRDHTHQNSSYVKRTKDFTPSVSKMKKWLDKCKAKGGIDGPEAVADALQDVLNLSWRDEAAKICVLISDAPPHGLGEYGDCFPDGCPNGIDPIDIARKMAQKGIILYCLGCEPNVLKYKDFFMGLAYITGGQYTPLKEASLLTDIIVGSVQEELSLQKWMSEVDEEFKKQIESGNEIDDEILTKQLHEKLKSKNAQVNVLKRNDADLGGITDTAKIFSSLTHMGSAKSVFRSSKPQQNEEIDTTNVDDVWTTEECVATEFQVNRMLQKAKAQIFY